MRRLLAALVCCVSLFVMVPAEAGYVDGYGVSKSQHGYHSRGARAERFADHISASAWKKKEARQHYVTQGDLRSAQKYQPWAWSEPVRAVGNALHLALSAPCRIAASLGGPCGCVASERLFGHSVRALWTVSAWMREFSRAAPAPGMVAIWPGRHVEVVEAVNRDNTVTTSGPLGIRRVSIHGLVFVNPHGTREPARRRHAQA